MKLILLIAFLLAAQDSSQANDKLLRASSEGDSKQVSTLLAAGADPNATDRLRTPLVYAILHSSMETVDALIAGGADVNRPSPMGTTPLYAACGMGSTEVVRLLIAKGADVNGRALEEGITPLIAAINAEPIKIEIIQLLLKSGADPNAECYRKPHPAFPGRATRVTPLSLAKEYHASKVAKLLREAGAKK